MKKTLIAAAILSASLSAHSDNLSSMTTSELCEANWVAARDGDSVKRLPIFEEIAKRIKARPYQKAIIEDIVGVRDMKVSPGMTHFAAQCVQPALLTKATHEIAGSSIVMLQVRLTYRTILNVIIRNGHVQSASNINV